MSERLIALGRRPVFSVEGVTYCWDDVLASASARGTLEELRTESRQGVACARRPAGLEDGLDQEAVSAAAASFRYERGLLSAEELDQWLGRWELTVREWGDYLERTLLLERRADELETVDPDVDDAAVEEAGFVDAVCSGFLEREAHLLATDAALAGLAADEADGEGATRIERITAAAAAARAGAISDSGVEREIAARGLDWTRLSLDLLEVGEEDAAREVALCVRLDGRPIAEVAAECGASLRHMSIYLVDVQPEFKPALLAAQPGELVGPVAHDDAFVLFAIHERTRPSSSDRELRQRAEEALVERAVRRAVEARLEWHEHI